MIVTQLSPSEIIQYNRPHIILSNRDLSLTLFRINKMRHEVAEEMLVVTEAVMVQLLDELALRN